MGTTGWVFLKSLYAIHALQALQTLGVKVPKAITGVPTDCSSRVAALLSSFRDVGVRAWRRWSETPQGVRVLPHNLLDPKST